MKTKESSTLDQAFQTIQRCTKKPELFLSVQQDVAQDVKYTLKYLYDLAFKKKAPKTTKALPELLVEDADSEFIWQQVELENNEEFSRVGIENFSRALASKNWSLPLRTSAPSDDKEAKEEAQSESELAKHEDENEAEASDHASEEEVSKDVSSDTRSKRKRKHNEVDDKFFKLEDLNKFLKMEDERESGKKQEVDSDDEELQEIDLFNDIPDSEDENEENDENRNGDSLKYADFFDTPEVDDDEDYAGEEQMGGQRDDDYDDDEEEDDEEYNSTKTKNPSPFFEQSDSDDEKIQSTLEKRKERLKKRIDQLEDEVIKDKPWQLKGEVSSKDRPVNSLLEEFVEFDQVTRPAPVMTEQTTMKLEDIIRHRIKDKAWDDVEKKVKPVETPMEYKKKLIMNQEKSKESLAQIYENEYVKQREALASDDKEEQQVEEPPEHDEIRKLMHSLFVKLDALSNFHYTPKPAKPEIKIVSNVPAISMEEVAPVATSDAVLLAPEEIQSKQKGDLIGKSERTKTDMKRARRKKKLKQQARALDESKKNPNQKSASSHKTKKIKGRNILNMDDTAGGKSIKSSTAFFTQLQDQVSSSINKIKSNTTAKKNKNTLSAVKLKL